MAKVYFAPYKAMKFKGDTPKEYAGSLARPKPKLRRGDIVIVDSRTAFNAVNNGFGEFEAVESIEFTRKDTQHDEHLQMELEALLGVRDENEVLKADKETLLGRVAALSEKINGLTLEIAVLKDTAVQSSGTAAEPADTIEVE